MASLGHLAVGMAAARVYRADSSTQHASWGAMLAWAALSFLPDADVIGFGFGVRYEDEWGHRGATHSLVFALAVGVVLGLLAPLVRRSAVRTGVMATLVLASHSLLDTFTDGGLGCALLWPFDDTRYFAPWRPLPVSPIGLGYLSPYGMYVAVTEIALFAPVFWYAFRSRTAAYAVTSRDSMRALLIVGWLLSIWLLMSSDPLRERAVGSVLSDTTLFTAGFSDARFSAVERGDSAQDVRVRLGTPFSEFLLFDERPNVCGMGACRVGHRRRGSACRSVQQARCAARCPAHDRSAGTRHCASELLVLQPQPGPRLLPPARCVLRLGSCGERG